MNEDNYISIQEPIANAKAQLGISYATEDHYLQLKAFEAELQIASSYTITRKSTLVTITDFQAEVPQGFHSLVQLRLVNDSACEYPSYIKKSFYRVNPDSPNTFENSFAPSFDINDGVIYFSTDVTATQCEIAYNAYNTDEDGYPRIHHTHEVAIVNYVCWQYTLSNYDRFPDNIRTTYERTWRKKCDQARAKSKMPDPVERTYMRMLWNNHLKPYNHIW